MNSLAFHETKFSIITQNDRPWLTAAQIAQALGYAREDAVSRIYARNTDEFTPCMTMTVKLTANGINNSMRENEARIFSLRGAHLIAMFSRTERAKEFRRWVLDVLDKETTLSAPLHIHFPAETASPHDRKFGNDWFTARTILDERNRAPEQELLVLLEASGFDVTGASIRIHAMYGIIKQFLGVQRELAIASHHSSTITDILYSATRERGDNVSFTGDTCGKTYGGQSTRTLPRR
ncbi:MAG: BRO-N domain-containing protein [Aeromonas sp.]